MFVFIALLLSSLFFLQFWLIQNFTNDVSGKIGEAAYEVSLSTVKTLVFRQPNIALKSFAISKNISVDERVDILNSVSSIASHVNISLQDGQKDKFLTINSAGENYKIDIPRTGIQNSLDDMSSKIMSSAIIFIVIGLLTAAYFSRLFSKPLSALQIASEQVGRGDFGIQIENQQKFQSVEIKNTITAFNEMSQKIQKLQQENEILQKQAHLSELSEITRGLAHTIRNPLNTLNLAIDELTSADEKESKEELVRISKFQVKRIDKWVRSLMDVMSTDSSLIETINLENLVESCVEDISLNNTSSVQIEVISNHLTSDNKTQKDIALKAIKPELKSLLQSLIANAVESTETVSLEKKNSNRSDKSVQAGQVIVNLSQTEGAVKISIEDQGIGFSQEVLDKLFSPHNTNKTYGAGMGLYLAHRIITLKYSGELSVNNKPLGDDRLSTGALIELTLKNRV